MAGAMAGSAVLMALDKVRQLEIVTVTINNVCNLHCPHCYLQYGTEKRDLIDWKNISHIFESSFKHFCVVGKEPLANKHAAALTSRVVALAADDNRSISFITNGLNLRLLDRETLGSISWIDVSLDGGPQSYAGYRGGSYSKLVRGIEYARESGLHDLRILQTISSGNVAATGEALKAALSFDPRYVVVSPFQSTRHDGSQTVTMVPPSKLLEAMESAGAHADERIWLTLDRGYVSHFDEADSVERLRESFGTRFVYVDSDPIDRGIIRVTYDGLVLSPFESVHTEDYRQHGRPLLQRSLADWYQQILTEASPFAAPLSFRPSCH
jgi:MoaA/NifB/PqqE/SkfB family radical SAM enzyme